MEQNRLTRDLPVTQTGTHLGVGAQKYGNRLETTRLNQRVGPQLQAVGTRVIRYGLALVVGWIGFMKFTGYEAAGIQPFVASSPIMSWIYSILSVRGFSTGLGVVEVTIAALITLRPWFPKVSAAGSAAAVLMFLTTISFLFSAPGWELSLGDFQHSPHRLVSS